jgi:hypothetical protein
MEIDFLESEIIPFKNGELEQFEIRVKWQDQQEEGTVSGYGLTVEQAIIDLCDSVQKSVMVNQAEFIETIS